MSIIEDLVFRMRAVGSPQVITAVAATGNVVNQAAQQFANLSIPILGVVAALSALTTVANDVGKILLNVTGIPYAARFQQLEIGFERILRSGAKAKQLLQDLRQLGAETPFNTVELAGFARTLLAQGFAQNETTRALRIIADTVSAMPDTGGEGGTETVRRLSKAISDIRGTPRGVRGQELIQLVNVGVNLAETVNAAKGTQFQSVQEAAQFLKTMTGKEAADIILEGLSKRFGGMAQAMGLETLLGLLQNIGETINNAILPTGRIFVMLLTPLAVGILAIVHGLQAFNEATAGFAGLFTIVFLLTRSWSLLLSVMVFTVQQVNALTASLMRMTMATRSAFLTSMAIQARAAVAGGGLFAGVSLASLGPMIMNFIKSPIGLGLLGIAATSIGGLVGGTAGNAISNIGGMTSLGAMIGSAFSPAGTLIGAGIGAVAGIGKTLYDYFTTDNSLERTADASERSADALEDIRSQLLGGGPRANAYIGSLEVEMAMARMLGAGQGLG